MGKTIRGFNGQPSEPDYPLPADLPFSVAPTQDNGSRALAERLAEVAPPVRVPPRTAAFDPARLADAILANGAAFLPDAAELNRLRRIEAAVRAFFDGDPADWPPDEEWDPTILAIRAALAPEGSAGTPRGSGPPEKGPYDPDRIRERVARAVEGSARDGG